MRIKNQWSPPLSVSPPPSSPSPEPHRPPQKDKDPESSDMPHVMVSRINGRICSENDVDDCMGLIYQDPEEEEESTTEENILNATNQRSTAEISAASSVTLSLSRHVAGRWCEEEKAYPLKKRRVSFERLLSQETLSSEKHKKTTTTNNTNKRDEKKYWVNSEVEKNSAKIMERRLRCNRTNGQGWRCSQQRLAGRAMCKYHVKMYRLRTRGQAQSRSAFITKPKMVKNFCDDERFLVGKERKRIGVVKARSLSSLLRQTVPILLPNLTF